MMTLFDQSCLIQEVFFRYSHETNKILFWLNTVRQIFDFLFRKKICKAMLVFGCLILMKAKSRCKLLIQSLVRRENKYKLGRFCEFLESPKYEAAIAKFKLLLSHTRTMEASVRKVKRFFFFIKYYHLDEILGGSLSDSEFQKIVGSQLLGTIKERLKKTSAKSRSRKLR